MSKPTTGEILVFGPDIHDPELLRWARTLRGSSDQRAKAAAIDAAIAEAVKAEREACAAVADEHAKRNFPWGSENSGTYHAQANWAERIAKAIRARSGQ